MAATYSTVTLAQRPKANIVPGETFTFNKNNRAPSANDLKDGEVIFETNYLSVDPAMRGWLNDTRSYIPPVKIGEIMRGSAVGTIKASKDPNWPVGSYASGVVGWTELAVVKGKTLEKIQLPKGGRLTDSMAVLGEFFPLRYPVLDISLQENWSVQELICGGRNHRSHCIFRTARCRQGQSWRLCGRLGCCWCHWERGWTNRQTQGCHCLGHRR